MKLLKSAKALYIILCVIFIAVGVGLVVRPEASLKAVSRVVGVLVTAFGVVRIMGYFADDLYGLAFQFDLALGIFAIVSGVVFLTRSELLISIFPAAIGAFVLINGLFSVRSAIGAKRFGLARWKTLFAFAVLTVLVGAALVFNPYAGAKIMTRFAGIAFAASGSEKLVAAISAIKTKKNKRAAGPAEADYVEIKSSEDDWKR